MAIKVDIIILSNSSKTELQKLTENALVSLVNSEDPEKILFNILVIESNLNQIPYTYPNTQTIYPKKKFGFHKFFNVGIKLTSSTFVCLCNNDLIFHPGWATEILKAFKNDPELYSACPACSFHHPNHEIPLNSGNYEGHEVRREIAGWCLFFKRDMLKITGLLDEKFKFWYADNDYTNTLKKHNLKHALVTSSIVDHLESQTLKSKDEKTQTKLTHGERVYYEYKWEGRSYFSYLNWKRKQLFK